jgi:hypothetical protein
VLFERFLNTISRLLGGFAKLLPEPVDVTKLSKLDPTKIYVENVRSVLRVSARSAQIICETAVSQGLFERRIEVSCPDGAVAVTAADVTSLPERVICHLVEDGHYEEVELSVKDLETTVFYRFVDGSAS